MTNNDLLKHIIIPRFFMPGPITRNDGIVTPGYVSMPISDAIALNFVANAMVEIIKQSKVNTIAGCETRGIPVGAVVASKLKLPFIFVRKNPKAYSDRECVDGFLPLNPNVALVDDYMMFGEMKEKFIGYIHDAGGTVTKIVVFCELEQNRLEWCNQYALTVDGLVGFKESIKFLVQQKAISSEMFSIFEAYFTDIYHWQENKVIWNKFLKLTETEPLWRKR